MRILKTITACTFIALFLMGNGNIYANLNTQTISQISPSNTSFEITIDGVKHTVPITLAPSFAPVTIKITENGNVIFQEVSQQTSMVIGDITADRVVGDGIDHRANENDIGQLRLEVSQNGIVLLNKKI